jgi:hypothetical protein
LEGSALKDAITVYNRTFMVPKRVHNRAKRATSMPVPNFITCTYGRFMPETPPVSNIIPSEPD